MTCMLSMDEFVNSVFMIHEIDRENVQSVIQLTLLIVSSTISYMHLNASCNHPFFPEPQA